MKKSHIFFAGILGIVAALFITEIALRTTGNLILKKHTSGNSDISATKKTILCIGDSFTMGTGASDGESYPEQLQKMIDKNAKTKYQVINKGIGGYNTYQTLKTLENSMNEFDINIRIVIFLAGINNFWNFIGATGYNSKKPESGWIKNFILDLKIYKLIKLFFSYKSAPVFVEEQFIPPELENILGNSNEEFAKGNLLEAIEMLKKGLLIDKNSSLIYREIARYYVHLKKHTEEHTEENTEAQNYALKALEIKPNEIFNYNPFILSCNSTEEAIDLLKKLNNNSPITKEYIRTLEMQANNKFDIINWIIHDIEKVHEFCKDNNITFVLLNYPTEYHWEYDPFNRLLEKNDFIFINQLEHFSKLLAKGVNKYDIFIKDGHCNSKGYNIMARKIFVALEKNKFFN